METKTQEKKYRTGIEICQYDMNGKLLNEFPSMVEAGWHMHMSPNVFARKMKKTREFGGYRWGIKGEKTQHEIEDEKIRNMFPSTVTLYQDEVDMFFERPSFDVMIQNISEEYVHYNAKLHITEDYDEVWKSLFPSNGHSYSFFPGSIYKNTVIGWDTNHIEEHILYLIGLQMSGKIQNFNTTGKSLGILENRVCDYLNSYEYDDEMDDYRYAIIEDGCVEGLKDYDECTFIDPKHIYKIKTHGQRFKVSLDYSNIEHDDFVSVFVEPFEKSTKSSSIIFKFSIKKSKMFEYLSHVEGLILLKKNLIRRTSKALTSMGL